MFGIKSQGQKNFERCQLKVLESVGQENNGGRLDCPVTGPNGFTTYPENARNNLTLLARKASKRLCGSCVFADMSPMEYTQRRMEEVAAEEMLTAAEHRLALTRIAFQEDLVERREIPAALPPTPGQAGPAELPPATPPVEG
jgi:hypothetical protein